MPCGSTTGNTGTGCRSSSCRPGAVRPTGSACWSPRSPTRSMATTRGRISPPNGWTWRRGRAPIPGVRRYTGNTACQPTTCTVMAAASATQAIGGRCSTCVRATSRFPTWTVPGCATTRRTPICCTGWSARDSGSISSPTGNCTMRACPRWTATRRSAPGPTPNTIRLRPWTPFRTGAARGGISSISAATGSTGGWPCIRRTGA